MSVRSAEAIVQATPRQRSETVAQNLLHRLAEGLRAAAQPTDWFWAAAALNSAALRAENQAVERDIDGTVSTPARSRNTFNAETTASDGVARSCAGSGQRGAARRRDI